MSIQLILFFLNRNLRKRKEGGVNKVTVLMPIATEFQQVELSSLLFSTFIQVIIAVSTIISVVALFVFIIYLVGTFLEWLRGD